MANWDAATIAQAIHCSLLISAYGWTGGRGLVASSLRGLNLLKRSLMQKPASDIHDDSDFIFYPTNKVVGIIDDPDDAKAALRDLRPDGTRACQSARARVAGRPLRHWGHRKGAGTARESAGDIEVS